MDYTDYTNKHEKAVGQRNIMALVGNGFDIQVLKKYQPNQLLTTYEQFYQFFMYMKCNKCTKNLIINKMTEAKNKEISNWSDFESLIPEIIKDSPNFDKIEDKLENDLENVQENFSRFLNNLVTPEIEIQLGNLSQDNELAKNSLSKFLSDLSKEDYKELHFARYLPRYTIYNYLFVNFNYTYLLDDYIHLDKKQFDRSPYKSVDTNYKFYPNPNSFPTLAKWKYWNSRTEQTGWVYSDVIHPHGQQHIPRSMLFGSNDKELNSNKNTAKFNKEYWAQYNDKYSDLFDDTDLFIVYGSSIGDSDNWWWKKICESIENSKRHPELIIYSYYKDKFNLEDFVDKYHFADSVKLTDNIHVINYDDNSNLQFLSLKPQK